MAFKLEAKKFPGKIIFANDTVDVIFNIPILSSTEEPNYTVLQQEVKYYDSTGKKMVLKPENAKEIQFDYDNGSVRMLSRYDSLVVVASKKNRNLFLKLEADGKVKLFKYYYQQISGGRYYASTGTWGGSYYCMEEIYIMQRGDGAFKKPRSLAFKKDMIAYFSDCPELVKKIENDEYSKDHLEYIVNYYNVNCE